MIVNLTGADVRLYGPAAPDVIDDDVLDIRCTVIAAEDASAYLDLLSLGSPGDTVHGGRPVAVDLVEYHVRDLPPCRPGTRWVVSPAVALAARGRSDLLVPFGDVRDRSGACVGYRLLASPC